MLLFQDRLMGFVIANDISETGALEVAKSFEDNIFRSFGAPSLMRHDRYPRFMSEVFRTFAEMMGFKSRATLNFHPKQTGRKNAA